MMQALEGMMGGVLAGLVLVGIPLVWWAWESRWDARLFAAEPGCLRENLSARRAAALLSGCPDLQVLDVRTARETALGTLPGARRITWGEPGFRESVARMDRSRPVLVYCAGGYRSRKSVEVLRALGFRSVHHLHRGMMAWRRSGNAVVPPVVDPA
jgi:rhodanese-related sulfurtransferase